MSYSAYPEYIQSRSPSAPVSWQISKVKYLADYINGYAFKPDHWQGEGLPIIRIQNLSNDDADINRTTFTPPAKYLVRSGDILISWSATLDVFIWKREDAWLNQHIFKVLVNESQVLRGYFVWTANWFMNELNEASHGSTMQHLTADNFGSFHVPLPPLQEQTQIASFLDRETAKIDTLIDKQQQLIKLLKEKRQAVISHAVTKGLNPDAKMKDSGVEWLGEVPEHWNVRKLRYLGECQNGINIGAEYFGAGHPFVSYGDVYRSRKLPEKASGLVQSTELDRIRYSVLRGDILFTRTSETIDEIGFSSACLKTIENATFAGFLIRLRPHATAGLSTEYAKYYFQNVLLRAFFVKEMNLVTRASLSQDLLKIMPVALPSENEQEDIAGFLDKKTSLFDSLSKQSDKAIELLKERRTALISAAVTGKIDVRKAA